MKKPYKQKLILIGNIFFLISFFFLSFLCNDAGISAQNIGVNTTGAAAKSSALLDVDDGGSNNKGMLIPRVALTDVNTYSPISGVNVESLIIYDSLGTATNSNGKGYYYWSGTKWIAIPAPSNGPGTNGQVLTSTGAGSNPQWSTLSNGGGGSTGCASCISSTSANQGNRTFASCRNACIALGAGWRVPTFDEELYIMSGALGTPTGGFIAVSSVWTCTSYSAVFPGAFNSGFIVITEDFSGTTIQGTTGTADCRCVK